MNIFLAIKNLLEMDQALNFVIDTITLLYGLNKYYNLAIGVAIISSIYFNILSWYNCYIVLNFIISLITFKERYRYKINKLNCRSN